MKRIWVSITIAVLVGALCVAEQWLIYTAVDDIKIFTEHVDSENLPTQKECEALIKKWEKKKSFLDIFLDHEAVDKISESLKVIKAHVKTNTEEDILAEVTRLSGMADTLSRSERFLLENIL